MNWQEREGGGCGGVGGRKEGKRGMCIYDHLHHMKDGRRAGGIGCTDNVGVDEYIFLAFRAAHFLGFSWMLCGFRCHC